MSVKLRLSVVKRKLLAKQFTLHELSNFVTKKGSELAAGDPNRKMKGRAVLLGDNVKDQDFSWAEFCELGSSPPSIEAAKALDAMGSMPGYLVKMAMLSAPSPKPCCLAPKLGLAFPRTVGQNIGGGNSHGQWCG